MTSSPEAFFTSAMPGSFGPSKAASNPSLYFQADLKPGSRPERGLQARLPRQPRRFERSKPNELWATEITEFPLAGGQSVWVIAYMDDYSRYIVSWGVYASCATELVLEILRRGISVNGGP